MWVFQESGVSRPLLTSGWGAWAIQWPSLCAKTLQVTTRGRSQVLTYQSLLKFWAGEEIPAPAALQPARPGHQCVHHGPAQAGHSHHRPGDSQVDRTLADLPSSITHHILNKSGCSLSFIFWKGVQNNQKSICLCTLCSHSTGATYWLKPRMYRKQMTLCAPCECASVTKKVTRTDMAVPP